MANTIKIKRRPASGAAGKPSSLLNGELAFNENDNILYYGYGSGVAGAASSIEQIGGSGYFAHRGGINASGVWPIGITGNSSTVTNGVYTTGDQTVGGQKTFSASPVVSGNLAGQLVFKSANATNGGNIIFDGVNLGSETSYIKSSTAGMDVTHATKIQLNSALEVLAANTSGNSVGYFAVFDSNPASSLATLKSVSKEQILDDIGAATSGLTITAGSGLVGGGTLSANRTFDVGQGDGISVSDNAIAVDSTVVRTTGTQTINGSKTFGNQTAFNNGISIGDTVSYLTGTGLVINWGDSGGQLASFVNGTLWSNSSIKLNANTTFDRPDNAGSLPFIINPTGYAGSGAVTQGFWRGSTIEVNKGGTGQTSYSNGQLLIGSGTSLAANTLTAGTGISIANGSGTITINNSTTGSTSIVVSGLEYQRAALTGDVTASQNNNATTIANDAVTNAKAANMAVNTIKGRITAGTGDPEDLTAANVRTIINVADGANNYVHPTDGANTTITAANLKVLSAITVNTLGHVTSVSSKDLTANDIPNISTDKLTSGTLGVDRGGTGAATLTSGNILVGNGTSAISALYSVETTLTGGSSAIPRADAVKTYVDNMIVSGIATNDAMIFKGAIDCSTNPNYPSGDRGWVYKISVAGKIGGASGPVVEVNDTIICGTDGTPSGTHAAVGSNWNILQTNIVDASILVTGPASATSGNFAMFDGATGKIVKDSSFSSSSFATAGHVHGNITNDGKIGSTSGLPLITTAGGSVTTGTFGTSANTFCVGNDSRLSDTRNTTNSITVNNSGAGDGSGFTFNGSAARTISYNSIGAPSTSGTNATGTWNISVTGNAATVTNGVYTTGDQTIAGVKTLSNRPVLNSGLTVQASAAGSAGTYFPVFTADPGTSSQTLTTRTASNLKTDLSLNNVENTALSTWAGSTSITTLGTIATGTWNATTIVATKGGTGQSSYAIGDLLYADTTTSLAKLADVATGNVLLAGGVTTAPSWGKVGLTTHVSGTLPVANGGTNQTSYTDGQLLIGNTTGNTLTKATLTEGTGIDITNGNGSITITHEDTSTLSGAQGSNGIASITVDGLGHVTAVTSATYLTAGTVCAAIVDCTLDGGSF